MATWLRKNCASQNVPEGNWCSVKYRINIKMCCWHELGSTSYGFAMGILNVFEKGKILSKAIFYLKMDQIANGEYLKGFLSNAYHIQTYCFVKTEQNNTMCISYVIYCIFLDITQRIEWLSLIVLLSWNHKKSVDVVPQIHFQEEVFSLENLILWNLYML